MVEFFKRCQTDETAVSRRKVWGSQCGCYRVVFARCRFGPRHGREAIRDVYYAEILDEHGWDVISHHRNQRRAFAACRADARRSRHYHPG